MTWVRTRPGLAATMLAAILAACSTTPSQSPPPFPTTTVAAETDAPTTTPVESPITQPSGEPSAEPSAGPSDPPPVTGIVPGSVNRTSLQLTVSYDVKALLTVGPGRLETATLLRIRNDSGDGIDRLELNTVAARIGGLRITEATVDDAPVKVSVDGQTLTVPLGGILPAGGSTAVRIGYRATLQPGLGGSNWMFTNDGGTIAMHRWIPWVSRKVPFDRPNEGEPFITPTSPKVDVEIVTDERMDLASPAASVTEVPAGAGRAWAFSVENVRDVSVVLAPSFDVFRGEAKGVPIRVYTRPNSFNGTRLVGLAEAALRENEERLGIDYPWASLSVVETQGGEALETPGLVWLPRTENNLNRTYLVHREIAQQWFYGLVGNDQQAEPFADEGVGDFLARTALNLFRGSGCPTIRLDRAVTSYSGNCFYEQINVQGGLFLDEVRQRMGAARFWAAMKGYLETNRFGLGGTKQLLDALRAGSDANLLPLFRARFPSLY